MRMLTCGLSILRCRGEEPPARTAGDPFPLRDRLTGVLGRPIIEPLTLRVDVAVPNSGIDGHAANESQEMVEQHDASPPHHRA